MSSEDAQARKRALRDRLTTRLAGVDREEARAAATGVADSVLELPEMSRGGGILTCLSFGTEIDTWGLLHRLLALERTVYVPRADSSDNRLYVHRYPCELETLSFGLRQPPRGTPEVRRESLEGVIDVVLVLGVGFDRRGYRLGHGNGYFDRFLADLTVPAVGLAYDFQLLDELPAEAHDIPMAAVVTEAGAWRIE